MNTKSCLALFFVGLLASASAQQPGDKLWEFPIGQIVQSSPAVTAEGTVYIGADNGRMYAFRPDGSLYWEFSARGNITCAPAIGPDGTVYFGSIDRHLYAVDSAGREQWAFDAESGIVSSPAIGSDGTIYFGTVFNRLFALKPDGKKKWEFVAGGNIVSSPAIGVDGTIYFGCFNDKLYAIQPDGLRKWDFTTGGRINSSPAIGPDGTIYIGSMDRKFYAIQPNGAKRWEYLTGDSVRSSAVVGPDGTVYFGSDDRKLHAVNADGSPRWVFATAYWIRGTPAVDAEGNVYIGSYDNRLYCVGPDGKAKWSFEAGAYISSSPAIDANGILYFGSWDKKLYALRANAALASSSWAKFRGGALNNAMVNTSASVKPAPATGKGVTSMPAPDSPKRPFVPVPTTSSAKGRSGGPTSAVAVQIKGSGKVSPSLDGELLEIGRVYTVRAEPGKDYQFVGWTGGVQTNSAVLKFAMQPNLVLQANFVSRTDKVRPTLEITTPAEGVRLPNPVFTVRGTAADNIGLARVECQLGDGEFKPVEGTKDWLIRLSPQPGLNTVRVRAIDMAGNESTLVSRNFYYVVNSSLTLQVTGDGTVTPPLSGRILELGKSYTLTAEPAKDHVFEGWTGGVVTNSAKITFVMTTNLSLQAHFVALPFQPVRGVYHGLFNSASAVSSDSAGYFTLNVNDTGGFTGSLLLAGTTHPLNGQFDLNGGTRLTLNRKGQNALTVSIQVDVKTAPEQISGQVSDGTFTAELLADRMVFDGKARKAPQAERYTLILPGGTNAAAGPVGDGFASVTVDANGVVRLSGELADGSVIAQEAAISKDGLWPVYVPLHGGRGLLFGWLKLASGRDSDIVGQLSWVKPASKDKYYPNGFTRSVSVLGSTYNSALAQSGGVGVEGMNGLLRGGDLAEVTLDAGQMKLSLATPTGILTGSFVHPTTKKLTAFKGAVLQKQNWRSGYFLGPSESGFVFLGMAQ